MQTAIMLIMFFALLALTAFFNLAEMSLVTELPTLRIEIVRVSHGSVESLRLVPKSN